MMNPAAPRLSRPFGTWQSPVSPQTLAESLRLGDVQWDRDGSRIVWLEGRGDKNVLVCDPLDGNAPFDLTSDLNVRARVGYGGGDFTVSHGHVIFVEARSGRLFRQPIDGGPAKAITPPHGCAALPAVSPDGELVMYVHSDNHNDCVAVVDVHGRHWPQRLAWKHDFFMWPCWSPDGTRVAWVAWDHPEMPWDGTTLCLATLEFGGPLPHSGEIRELAGSDRVAIFQPQFSPSGREIAYVADETGYGNLYLHDLKTGDRDALTSFKSELNRPAWVQGLRTWGFVGTDGKRLACVSNEKGLHRLNVVDLASRAITPVALDGYTALDQLALHPTAERGAIIAGANAVPSRVITFELPAIDALPAAPPPPPTASGSSTQRLPTAVSAANLVVRRRSMGERLRAEELAPVEPISWQSPDGRAVHGLWYAPTSTRFESGGRPPAVVMIHGGPTSQRSHRLDLDAQFLATRGFGVLQVNYRGSTGYGRAYMLALRGKWGVADLEDACDGAQHLIDGHVVDARRLAIMGGSAGGYTVLRALTERPGFFRAGINLFGVSDLFALAADTHKFESRYNDSLLGALPDAGPVWRERSPLTSIHKLVDPIAIFQGSEDKVVPPDQSERVVESLRARHVPHIYRLYDGEGHGFRKPDTLVDMWTSIEQFLQRHVVYA